MHSELDMNHIYLVYSILNVFHEDIKVFVDINLHHIDLY